MSEGNLEEHFTNIHYHTKGLLFFLCNRSVSLLPSFHICLTFLTADCLRLVINFHGTDWFCHGYIS